MTAQINDTCFHRQIKFSVAGISGTGLFDPDTLGVTYGPSSTACWRGYVAHYSILDDELFLTSLHLGLLRSSRARRRPKVFGATPTDDGGSGFLYEGFVVPVSFTGGLLLGAEFIYDLYVHMGFHRAWKYKHVREVIFESGRLIDDHDRSEQMAAARAKVAEDTKRTKPDPRGPRFGDVMASIYASFSRDY